MVGRLRKFTIVSKPLFRQDLQQILVQQMLSTDLFGDDDSFLHSYLHNLTALANEQAISTTNSEDFTEALLEKEEGSSLFKQLEQTLENTLSQYNSSEKGLSKKRNQAVYLLSMLRSIQKWEDFYTFAELQNRAVMLWEAGNPLNEVERDEDLAVEITHPQSELYTLPIWQDPDPELDQFWVADDSHLQYFRSNHLENIIYLPKMLGKELIELRLGEAFDKVRYKAVSVNETPFELPESLYCQQNSLVGTFFKEQKSLEEGRNPYIIWINAVGLRENVITPDNQIGWLNPLIANFDITQNDIQDDYYNQMSRAKNLVKLVTEPAGLLAVELHLDTKDDLRMLMLKKLIAKQQQENRGLSLLEYLMWGSQANEHHTNSSLGESFFVLDKLGGAFFVDDHGIYHKDIDPDTREELKHFPNVTWQAPQNLAMNAIWLKNHFLKSWVPIENNTEGDEITPTINVSDIPTIVNKIDATGTPNSYYVLPPFTKLINQTTRGVRRLNVKTKIKNKIKLPILQVLNSHPLVNLNTNDEKNSTTNLYEFIASALAELCEKSKDCSKHVVYYGEGAYSFLTSNEVKLDEIKLLENFSRHYLTPLSPVYIAVPDIEHGGPVYIEVVNSVQYGNKEFLHLLYFANSFNDDFADFEQEDFDKEDIKLAYGYGWWQDWFKTLFSKRWDVKINFVPVNKGFIINSSLLGKSELGLERVGQHYDAREMRI